METVCQRHLGRKGTDLDLVEQLNLYEVRHTETCSLIRSRILTDLKLLMLSECDESVAQLPVRQIPVNTSTSHHNNVSLQMTLRHEDGDDDSQPPPMGRRDRRRASLGGGDKRCGLERRRSRRASLGRSGHASPCSPASPQRAGFHPFNGQRAEDVSER